MPKLFSYTLKRQLLHVGVPTSFDESPPLPWSLSESATPNGSGYLHSWLDGAWAGDRASVETGAYIGMRLDDAQHQKKGEARSTAKTNGRHKMLTSVDAAEIPLIGPDR